MPTATLQGLAGQHVVLVGGSSGIGLAAAKALVAEDAAVTLIGRDPTRLAAAQRTVQGVNGAARVQTRAVDIHDEAAYAATLAGLDAVAHVVLTAGTAYLSDLIAGPSLDEQFAPLASRLRGALVAVRTLAPRMPAGGSFVFTGGLSTERPVKGAWVTGVATAAAEQLARVLALDLAPLRFNAISPGWTDTPMWDPLLGEAKSDVFTDVAAGTPIGRLVTAEEAADAALFLLRNRAMTGAVIHVDGGKRFT